MKINGDGTLSLPAQTLTTDQVDQLINELAKVRQRMTPSVADFTPSMNVLVQTDPSLFVGKGADGSISLALRHEGLGWCAFSLQATKAAQLQAFIAKRTGGQDVGFVDEQLPEGYKPN
jgi:hypothetical protein